MKFITTIPYNKTMFVFVTSYYDLNLKGTCIYENKLCAFNTIVGDWDEMTDSWTESFCEIYELTLLEKIKIKWRQKKFEWMVGYHYSYKNGKKQGYFHYRKPEWLYVKLFNLYYRLKLNK